MNDAEKDRFQELKDKAKTNKDAMTKEERAQFRELKAKKDSLDTARQTSKLLSSSPDDEEEVSNKRPRARGGKKAETVTTEEQIEPENRWWASLDDDDAEGLQKETIKWNTLEHHGILFPADYEPHKVPLMYGPGEKGEFQRKQPITLPPEVEEMATYWAANMGLPSETSDIFINNFWSEFTEKIKEASKADPKWRDLPSKITHFRQCDFSKIKEKLNADRDARKAMTKEEKEAEKDMKAKAEEQFRYCLIDGYREKVGTLRVEPPGLFKGRGEHPKQGKLKDRIMPENVTMNCDNCLPPPICTVPGRAWEQVVHDDSVNWLGYYKQETDEKEMTKYIQMDKTSEMKTKPDLMKYERARRLCKIVGDIRKDYQYKLTSGDTLLKKQIGTAAYFIDRLALRVGGEKNTDEEADTVGCCSLRVEHVKLDFDSYKANPNRPKVTLDFLGKDSIRYLNEVNVPPSVFKNLAAFMKNKQKSDELFNQISPSDVNNYLQEFMPDLTAKVFRTYNASFTLEQQLALYDKGKNGSSTQELIAFYNDANRKVAVLCNHQKAVAKTHGEGVEKLNHKYREHMIKLEYLNEHKEKYLDQNISAPESLDEYEAFAKARSFMHERNTQIKEANADASNPKKEKELTIDTLVKAKLPSSVDACVKQIGQQMERVKKAKHEIEMKEGNKNVSLTTSKINYMDPRITIAFCKRVNLDVNKVFSKTILQKFPWAMDVVKEYKFVKDAGQNKRVAQGNGVANGEPGLKKQRVM
ncbi:unnamed protein product [Amoebophrya sp. A120]|nr:unnamed protein product [Amoebophrya sp. A120]|eukprot:GSA120T00020699001.1